MVDVDNLNKVSDEQAVDDSAENKGLTPEFNEESNKVYMTAGKPGDTASASLPVVIIDDVFRAGDDVRDSADPDDKKETKEEAETASDKEAGKETVVVKIGDTSLPVELKVGETYIVARGADGVTSPNVSRRHAEIGRDEKGWYVKDLGSTNKTFVIRAGSDNPEPIPANEKVYLKDVSSVQFSKGGPSMEGGAPKTAPVEAPAPKASDTVIMNAPPDVRPVPEIGGKAVVNPDRIQRELTHAKMVGQPTLVSSEGEREVYRAKVMIDGQEREVTLRHTNNRDAADQARKELAAYELSKFLGVTNDFSPTSVREFEVNGVKKLGTIQLADQGKSLETELRAMSEKKYGNSSPESVQKLIEENPKLKQAIERAVAERVIFGDKGFEAKDFVISENNGEFRVSSQGIERGFATSPDPAMESKPGDALNAKLQSLFSGKEVPAEVKAKVAEFLEKYNNKNGYEQLKELGLSRKEIDHMMARAKVIAESGKFPVAETAVANGAANGDTKLSPAMKYNLGLSRNTMEPGVEFKTKEQVAAHMERVLNRLDELKKLNDTTRAEFKALIEAYKQGDPNAVKTVHAELALTFKVEPTGTVAAAADAGTSVKDLERNASTPEQRSAATEKAIARGTLRTLLGEAGVPEDKAKQLERDLLSKDKEVQEKARGEVDKAYASKGGYKQFFADAKGRASAGAVVVAAVLPFLPSSDN